MMVTVDHVREWRCLRHNAEPAEWVAFLVGLERRRRNRCPAHPVGAVDARDIVAFDRLLGPVFGMGHERPLRRKLVQTDVAGLIDNLSAGSIARRIKVFRERSLAVGHQLLAGKSLRVDEKPGSALPGDRRAVVRMTFAVHALAKPNLAQKPDSAVFEHAGADAFEHVCAALALQHNAVDTITIQNMREQQTGRAAADDRDLSARSRCHRLSKSPIVRLSKRISLASRAWLEMDLHPGLISLI